MLVALQHTPARKRIRLLLCRFSLLSLITSYSLVAQERFATASRLQKQYVAALDQVKAAQDLADSLRVDFRRAVALFQESMTNPLHALTSLRQSQPDYVFTADDLTFLSTYFGWQSIFNLRSSIPSDQSASEWFTHVNGVLQEQGLSIPTNGGHGVEVQSAAGSSSMSA